MWVHVGSYNLRHKGARKCLISLHFRAHMSVETVGVEDDSQAETRSPRGLRGFIFVGEHLGEHFSSI